MVLTNTSEVVYSGDFSGYSGSAYSGTLYFADSSTMVSFSNKRPYGRRSGDNGSPWKLIKQAYEVNPFICTGPHAAGQSHWGPVLPGTPNGINIPSVPMTWSDSELEEAGSTLLSRALPNNPSFSLATFLGELKEGIPRIVGDTVLRDKTNYLKKSGSEYLNVEFGWKPMVSDLRSFAYSVKNSKKIMDSYLKNSDTKIRRNRELTNVTSHEQMACFFVPSPARFNHWLSGTVDYTTTNKVWFSGAFRYHIPVSDTVIGKMGHYEALANRILGTRLTPAVVWELSPWSWAVDWFTNTGDIINNISLLGQDGMVMEYGYVMRTSIREEFKQATYVGSKSYFPGTHKCSLKSLHTVKQRLPASPYGFGSQLTELSPRQVAVLAALGLSRS